MPDVGTKFSFCGNHFMISNYNIDVGNLGLFIISHILVPPKQSVAVMPFCGPIYCWSNYMNIVKYKPHIYMYSMCMNGYVYSKFNNKNMLEEHVIYRWSSMCSWEHCRVHK